MLQASVRDALLAQLGVQLANPTLPRADLLTKVGHLRNERALLHLCRCEVLLHGADGTFLFQLRSTQEGTVNSASGGQ